MTEQIHHAFVAQARRTPDAVALVVGTRRTTYAELDRMSAGVALALRADGIRPGHLVAMCLERDEWLLAGLLGILRVGAAYLPLDPRQPAARLRDIVETAVPSRLLATAGTAPLVPGMPCTIADQPAPAGAPAEGGRGDDVAYVVYTSGSTGQPKGVMVEHRQAMTFIRSAGARLSPAEIAGALAAATIAFDAAVLELLVPLVHGGTVILAEDLLAVRHLPARDEVTMLFAAPAALTALLAEGVHLPALRTVNVGGEQLTAALRDRVFGLPGVQRMINWYGPTECAVACLADEMTAETVSRQEPGEPPLGTAVGGAGLSVRGADGEPVPDGDTGELWVSGPGVARGYLNRPDLTAERFVQRAGVRWYRTGDLVRYAAGGYHFAGRTDDQVKINGFRVEPGEVSAALSAHTTVGHASTVVTTANGSPQLVSYVEAAPGAEPTEDGLRGHLRDRLPAAMVPSRIVVLDRLPRTANGKVDRAALPAPGRRRAAHVPPRTEVESYVADVWADVLDQPGLGAYDDFFLLGGTSLSAARISARIAEQLGVPMAARTLLEHPALADFARAVEDGLLTADEGATL